jgi:signal transduction histidine kinase
MTPVSDQSIDLTFIAALALATRLAIALVFAGVLAALSSYLRHAFHRAMAWVWFVWAILALLGVIGWQQSRAGGPQQIALATLAGGVVMLMAMLSLRAVQLAADDPVRIMPRDWLSALSLGGVIGGTAHWWAPHVITEAMNSALVLTRALQLAGFLATSLLCVAILRRRRWLTTRLMPLALGSAGAALCVIMDGALRVPSPGALSDLGRELWSATLLTAAMIVHGVGTLWTALELEREHLLATASDTQQIASAAAESARLESLGNMAAGVAHDVNNMLTIIRTMADLVRSEVPEEAHDLQQCLRDVLSETGDAGAWSARLLRFARSRPGHTDDVAPGVLLESLAPMLQRVLPTGNPLRLAVRSRTPVRFDAVLFEQAVLNLVTNAGEAHDAVSQRTRPVHVSLRDVRPNTARPCSLGWVLPRDYVCLRVEDEGPGIAQSVRARLFDPFYSTKGPQRTGLGLYTVGQFALSAGGAVDVHSREGDGTSVEIFLPALSALQEESKPQGIRRLVSEQADGRPDRAFAFESALHRSGALP